MTITFKKAVQFHEFQLVRYKNLIAVKETAMKSYKSTMIALEALRMIQRLGFSHLLMASVYEQRQAEKESQDAAYNEGLAKIDS